MENNGEYVYTLELGLYPGILFGLRTYKEVYLISYVFYLPFVDICLTFYNNED